jgi:hypothetical protein
MRQGDFGTHVQFSVPLGQTAHEQSEVEARRS